MPCKESLGVNRRARRAAQGLLPAPSLPDAVPALGTGGHALDVARKTQRHQIIQCWAWED